MKEDGALHIPLTGTKAEEIFIRQKDDKSCGPACLATVTNLYHAARALVETRNPVNTYAEFCAAAAPNDDSGTSQGTMQALCQKFLPYETCGPFSYQGGIAIANIIQDGEGHYVVFLCKKDDMILYYEPYAHEFVVDKIQNIDWRSGFEPADSWSINFKPMADNCFERWMALATEKPAPPQASEGGSQKPKMYSHLK